MQLYDCHVHTDFSHDGKASMEEQCAKGAELSLGGITLTEHNYPAPKGFLHGEHIRASCEQAKKLAEAYGGTLQVFCGVEVADLFLDGCDNGPIYAVQNMDFLLGSVHSAAVIRRFFPDCGIPSLLGNGNCVSMDFARRFTERYFTELLQTAEKADVDAIAHMTYPLRYINGDGGLGLDTAEFSGIIDEIFQTVIKRDIAIEVNTSGYGRGWKECMPSASLLLRYYALGGRRITLGSDAHKPEQLAVGMTEAVAMLKEIGFTHASYYVQRKAQEYAI